MKLTELFIGYPGKIDPRLKNQVQKASVAAAKKPTLDLGVIGLTIKQKQSTGDTSRVSEE